MRYKAIITDVDGTAVPNALDAVPTNTVKRAIRKAQRAGAIVSVSTSRPLFIASGVIKKLGIRHVSAVNDSTQLYDPVSGKVIATFSLLPKAAESARMMLTDLGIRFMYNMGAAEEWFTEDALPDGVCGLAVPEYKQEDADALIERLTTISDVAVHKVKSYKPGLVWVTVTSPIATKLHSVLEITKREGVTPEETIGIGDGYNDFGLLSACGLKIAMGNAVPELKAIADFIAPSVEEDGLAMVIEKFILS